VTVSSALLKDLQRQHNALEIDLLAQSEQVPELAAWLEEQYAAGL
jgi:hypothetical protein